MHYLAVKPRAKLIGSVVVGALLAAILIFYSPSPEGTADAELPAEKDLRTIPPQPDPSKVVRDTKRVAGRVITDRAGEPNAVVRIETADQSKAPAVATLVTDANGNFGPIDWPLVPIRIGAISNGRTPRVLDLDLRSPQVDSEHIELVLHDCTFRVSGFVQDSGGGVVAGAFVRLSMGPGVVSGSDGAYSLCLPRGAQQLVVSASGYGPVAKFVQVVAHHRLDFSLQPSAYIRGSVETVAGVRVPFADVVAFAGPTEPRPAIGRTRCKSDGSFELEVAAGEFSVSASAVGLASVNQTSVAVHPADRSEAVTVVVEAVGRASGRVLEANAPVSGAGVWLKSSASRFLSSRSVTDSDGRFTIQWALREPSLINVEGFDVLDPQPFTPDIDATTEIVVRVAHRAEVRVRVAREGKAVDGAQVTLLGARSEMSTTNVDGEVVFRGIEPGTYAVSACEYHARECSRDRQVVVDGRANQLVELELDASARISGRVLSTAGDPVSEVSLNCVGPKTVEALSGEDGAFDCGGLIGGSYDLRITSRGRAVSLVAPTKAVLKGDTDSAVVDVRVRLSKGRLRGSVVDGTKAPARDVVVRVSVGGSMLSATTDANGAFSFEGVPDKAVAVSCSDPVLGDAEKTAEPGEEVLLVLVPRTNVEVRAQGFSTVPVVRAQELTTRIVTSAQFSKGTHRMRLAAGEYVLTAAGRGGEGDATRLRVAQGQNALVVLERRSVTRLSGVVRVFGTNAPVPAARCGAVAASGGEAGTASSSDLDLGISDTNGHFSVAAPSGEVVVSCGSALFGGASRRASLPTESDVVMDLASRGGSGSECGIEFVRSSSLVARVEAGSRAAQSGFQPGDRVVSVAGNPVEALDSANLRLLLDSSASALAVAVDRGGTSVQLTLSP